MSGHTCLLARDCIDGICDATHHCAVATCTDGVQNGTETGLDCGGPCPVCPAVLVLAGAPSSVMAAASDLAGAWTTTTLTGGTPYVPTLTTTAIGIAIGAFTATDGTVSATIRSGTSWSAPTMVATGAREHPSIDATESIVAHLTFQDTTYHYVYARYVAGLWSSPAAIGSYGPSPAAIVARAANATLAFVNGEGAMVNYVASRDLTASTWGARVDIQAASFGASASPAIVALSTGPELLVTFVRPDTSIAFTTRTGGVWSTPAAIANCFTGDRLALAHLPSGAILAFRGQDGNLYWTVYTAGAWSAVAPLATPNVAIDSAPAVTHGIGAHTAEIAYVSGSTVYASSLTAGTWSTPTMVASGQPYQVAITSIP